MKTLKKIWHMITLPVASIVAVAVLYDESRRQNLDGSWNKYWARKNARALKKEERKNRRKSFE